MTEQIRQMKSPEDLAKLLDAIKEEEFRNVRYSITANMLRHFCSDSIAPKRFRTFKIRKKSGGYREIKAPCRQLDVILTCINILLKSVYKPSDAAMGFTSGRSVLTNAQAHVGHNYVFNIDLKDFFPSIPQPRVWKRLQLAPFNFSREIANIVAGLCCSHDEASQANVLPQGSPTSPLLTNAICDTLDRRMKGVAKRFGLHYTRYADDMTFSSMHNVYQENSEFRNEIRRIIASQGFRMNEAKTRLQKTGTRQEVTGLTVNAVANVSRQYKSDLRWILHIWETEGYAKAYALFYPKYKHEKGYIKKGEPVMENVIGGKLNYLKMVRGANNEAYRKLAARYDALQQLVFVDNETDDSTSYVYVQPYSMAQFQELFHTTVSLEVSSRGKLVGKCELDGREKTLAISKNTQKLLCPQLQAKAPGVSVASEALKDCFVTLCRHKGKNFWLVTRFEPKRSRCMSVQNLKVDPDELLSLWEENGLDNAGKLLALFIQYGLPGESLYNIVHPEKTDKSAAKTDAQDPSLPLIDRGIVKDGSNYLLSYLLNNKHLNPSQKKRLFRLITQTHEMNNSTAEAEILLTVWETKGLDEAIATWKEMEENKKSKSKSKATPMNTTKTNNDTTHPDELAASLAEDLRKIHEEEGLTLEDIGITEEELRMYHEEEERLKDPEYRAACKPVGWTLYFND